MANPNQKRILWNPEKNEFIKRERGVSFEELEQLIRGEGLLYTVPHPNQGRYPGQQIFVVKVGNYIFMVPFVEGVDYVFLKTCFPSRKSTRDYL